MRNRIKNSVVVVLTILAFVGCSKDDDSNDTNSNSANQVRETVVAGTWKITYFFDTDEDETSNFTGYVFTFQEDGTLTAVNGNNTVTGSWQVLDDSSNSSTDDDGGSTDDDDFIITFPVPETNDFEDLNDDWDIISVTANKIELTDVSGGNGGTDFLTFEKI
ncbi:MAG: hypothetical protein R3359_00100 [Marinirhabdus sp.]|nr:hypothetical protein [Marinirhabdus sp.]